MTKAEQTVLIKWASIKENKCNFKQSLAFRKFYAWRWFLIQFPSRKFNFKIRSESATLYFSDPTFITLRLFSVAFQPFSFRSQNASIPTFVMHERNHSKCIPTNDGWPQTNPVKKRYDRVQIRLNPGLCQKSNSGRIE